MAVGPGGRKSPDTFSREKMPHPGLCPARIRFFARFSFFQSFPPRDSFRKLRIYKGEFRTYKG